MTGFEQQSSGRRRRVRHTSESGNDSSDAQRNPPAERCSDYRQNSFFGREKDIICVQTSRDCEGAVKLLNEVFADNKAEILDFLQALSAKKKAEEKEKKEEEKSEVSVAGWNKKGA